MSQINDLYRCLLNRTFFACSKRYPFCMKPQTFLSTYKKHIQSMTSAWVSAIFVNLADHIGV